MAGSARLGIDFGTSTTVAVLTVDGREPRPLLFDGSPLLPSAVWVEPTGRLLVGRDAVRSAVSDPSAYEAHPKRCVDDGTMLLGVAEFDVPAVFRAVLDRVVEAATAVAGPIDEIVVTCPAAWGAQRQAVLLEAAPAGTRLVSEPVAAAHYFAEIAGHAVPVGGSAVVYDFGAGTFDASVVQRTADGFTVVASLGRHDSGGLDIDAAIVEHLAATVPDDAAWARLQAPQDAKDRRARQQLWDNVRDSKELLSRTGSTLIHVPLLDVEVPLGREELDRLAAPVLERTLDTTRAVVGDAAPAAIFLAGGSSRMPAVVTALHRAFGITPVTADQPELVVAEGSIRTASGSAQTGDWPAAMELAAAAPVRRKPRVPLLAAGATAVVLAAGVGVAFATGGDTPGRPAATAQSASPSPSPSPSRTYAPGIDPCMLGKWRSTGGTSYSEIDKTRVMWTDRGGSITEYREDGTTTEEDTVTPPRYGELRGARYEVVFRGVANFRWSAQNGELQLTLTGSTSTYQMTKNGKNFASGKTIYFAEPIRYTCNENRLQLSSTLGNWNSSAERINP
ncbi:Hsp70 family protein [Dactylosporangium sp. NBC_01737]|uniref:Hsp70 family protein n=1 Tax=Dactylosporangium sp. NBC_01737 TaxID=2975959 RepID=UPI002E10F066|nr:Hsp70 family protein [Dactylosporangium sp. NBC_01737]